MTPCINLYPTAACDAKNDNRKQNTIASYAMKKFGIEYQGFLLRFCTHRNYFNWVFRSTKLRKYAIRSLIWSYVCIYLSIYLSIYLYCITPSRGLHTQHAHSYFCLGVHVPPGVSIWGYMFIFEGTHILELFFHSKRIEAMKSDHLDVYNSDIIML